MAYRRHIHDQKEKKLKKTFFYKLEKSTKRPLKFDDISSTYSVSPRESFKPQKKDSQKSKNKIPNFLKGTQKKALVKQASGSTAIDDIPNDVDNYDDENDGFKIVKKSTQNKIFDFKKIDERIKLYR